MKQTTKDERLNSLKQKIACKPAQNFVNCSHLYPFNVICAEFVPSNVLFFYSAHRYFYCSTTSVPNSVGVALSFQELHLLVITGLTSAILNSVDCWFSAGEIQ